MAKFRKRPIIFEAFQWFKNGDHPEDGNETFTFEEYENERCEGKVVRYFRHPYISSDSICSKCGIVMNKHGWIDTLEDGHNVCPGDWIMTGIQGEYYPIKPNILKATYELVEE